MEDGLLRGKTALVTGGASGIGECYTRALVKAGAYVLIADVNAGAGEKLEQELDGVTAFVQTDVTSWEDQLNAFKLAIAKSASHTLDVVVANAGISIEDSLFLNDVAKDEPDKPSLKVIDVNLIGVLYSVKLALFYFRKQHVERKGEARDLNLVIQGSLAGYLDIAGSVEYTTTKWAKRGLMRVLRKTEHEHNIRVNYIGPWFIRTGILSNDVVQHLSERNIELAELADSGAALMHILSNTSVHGRAFAVVPRSMVASGYQDLDDDFVPDTLLAELQRQIEEGGHAKKVESTFSLRQAENYC